MASHLHRLAACLAIPALIACIGVLVHGQPQPPTPAASLAARLDRRVAPGSALEAIKRVTENRLTSDQQRGDRADAALPLDRFAVRMPAAALDAQDRAPLPAWFRAYLRQNFPLLPRRGRYQYPRASFEVFQWMLAHQNLQRGTPATAPRLAARAVSVGANVNISNLDERDSESSIAIDRTNPQILIAASNNPGGSGLQRQYSSANGGTTWAVSELPFPPATPGALATAFQCDPSVAFTSDGTAWTATLGVDSTGNAMAIQMYRSADHGRTWTYVATVSNTTSNDKEMIAIDTVPTSPFKDSIYVAWDVPAVSGGIRFNRSNDGGRTWKGVTSLSTDQAIGVHVATGPGGEVYVAWPDTDSRQIKIRRSTDGGATFSPATAITTTTASYEVAVPAMCERNVLVYVTIGVDKSSGPRKGTVYAIWTDLTGTEPGCTASPTSGNTSVFFSSSADGARWATPASVRVNDRKADQFNPWMDVDEDGSVHVVFYDTRDDPARAKTHLYYIASSDGGRTWVNEARVTTAQTDETASGSDSGNQYGDYNGLSVFRAVAHPIWTDRRARGGKEQVFTATIRGGRMSGPSTTNGAPQR
jgi:hypothetical protein